MGTGIYVSYLLIAAVAAVTFAAWNNPRLFELLKEEPYRIVYEKKYFKLLSGGFLHADITHLLFNMITLYFFAPYLEAELGVLPLLSVYSASLAGSALFAVLLYRKQKDYSAVGASGAVSGIVSLFAVLHPFEKLYIFMFPLGVPAIVYAILFILYSFYAMKHQTNDGIAHSGHFAGAVVGLLWGLIWRLI